MSAQAIRHAPSGRFIRNYLLVWGLLAAGGLTYLASVAWQVDLRGPAGKQEQAIDPELGVRIANRALAEVGSVKQTVSAIQRDLGRLKETVDQRDAQDREAQARLSALEEKVTSLATPPPVAAAPLPNIITPKKTADKAKAADQRTAGRVVTVGEGANAAAPADVDHRLETGSIPAEGPTVTFGEPEVKPAKPTYSVQLGAGPSLDALRLRWSDLSEKHSALALLKPRFVPPKAGSSTYRLIAGPLPSKADADKVCADTGLGRQACIPTTAIGQPL